jgi:hypothetical protein
LSRGSGEIGALKRPGKGGMGREGEVFIGLRRQNVLGKALKEPDVER